MCQNLHSSGSFDLCIMSQVKHIKKCSSIDSESKSVKQNADHQNHLTVCFCMLLQYYHMVRKHFVMNRVLWLEALTDQACVIVLINRRTPATILLVLQGK